MKQRNAYDFSLRALLNVLHAFQSVSVLKTGLTRRKIQSLLAKGNLSLLTSQWPM